MPTWDRRQRQDIDVLVEEYTKDSFGRREFLRRATALGLSASAAGALLSACGGSTSKSTSKTVDVLNQWGGEEAASFQAMIAPFEKQSGITINSESTRDEITVLTTRVRANNPPNVAAINPNQMAPLAQQGKLVALDGFLDMNQMHSDYSQGWLDLGTFNGHLYGIFMKATNKGTVWYNPSAFSAGGYSTPSTWDDMITLSNQIASKGKYPWSMGVSSSSSSGWPAADWIDEIFLLLNGPDLYDKWVAHQIPWTDASVKKAFQMFGQIVTGNHYINGAPQSILATGFQEASYLPFQSPPAAYMYYLGDFTEGFITSQFKNLKAGTDFDFFPFPTINNTYSGAITGGADGVSAFTKDSATQDFIKYLASASAQEIWVKRGGFTSVNKSVPLSAYPDKVAAHSAQMLTTATTFRYGADDLMPPAMETAYWKATLQYIQNPGQLDSILSSLESTASSAYTS